MPKNNVDIYKIWNTDKDILAFRKKFKERFGVEPDINNSPNDYDYKKAIKNGVRPVLDNNDGLYHWDSKYKGAQNKRNYINPKNPNEGSATPIKGYIDTKTGKTITDTNLIMPNNKKTPPTTEGQYQKKSHSSEKEINALFHLLAEAKKGAKSDKDIAYWNKLQERVYQYQDRIRGHESTGDYVKGSKVIDELKNDKILGEYYNRYKKNGDLGTGINNKPVLPKFDAKDYIPKGELSKLQPSNTPKQIPKDTGTVKASTTTAPAATTTPAVKEEMTKVDTRPKAPTTAPVISPLNNELGAPKSLDIEAQQQARLGKFGLGDVADLARFGLGMSGALEKLPEYNKPKAWTDYVGKMQRLSNIGFTPEEWTGYTRDNERNYALGVSNIANIAGGNAGAALGNLSAASGQLQDTRMKMGIADAEMRRRNLAQYGQVLGADTAMDRQIFEDKYNGVAASKQAGAGLASEALQNFVNRRDYNRTYEDPNSPYQQMQQEQIKGLKYDNDIRQRQLNLPAETFANIGYSTPTSTSVINPMTGKPYTNDELIKLGMK